MTGEWRRYILACAADAEPGHHLVTLEEAQASHALHWWRSVAITGLRGLADGNDRQDCLIAAFVTAQANGGRRVVR